MRSEVSTVTFFFLSEGGRLDEELSFLQRVQASTQYNESQQNTEIVRENGLGGGYQVVIQVRFALSMLFLRKYVKTRFTKYGAKQRSVTHMHFQTPEYPGQNALDHGPLLKHVEIMREIANYTVQVHGV